MFKARSGLNWVLPSLHLLWTIWAVIPSVQPWSGKAGQPCWEPPRGNTSVGSDPPDNVDQESKELLIARDWVSHKRLKMELWSMKSYP